MAQMARIEAENLGMRSIKEGMFLEIVERYCELDNRPLVEIKI